MAETLEIKPFRHPDCHCDEAGSEKELVHGHMQMQMTVELTTLIDANMILYDMCRRSGIHVLASAACSFSARTFPDAEQAKREVLASVDLYFEQLEVQRRLDERMNKPTGQERTS